MRFFTWVSTSSNHLLVLIPSHQLLIHDQTPEFLSPHLQIFTILPSCILFPAPASPSSEYSSEDSSKPGPTIQFMAVVSSLDKLSMKQSTLLLIRPKHRHRICCYSIQHCLCSSFNSAGPEHFFHCHLWP